jgi:hypothetical protein
MLQSRRTLETLQRDALLDFELPGAITGPVETLPTIGLAASVEPTQSIAAAAAATATIPARPAQGQRNAALFSLLIGCTAFSCGAVLMIYSWLMARPDLWNPGLIVAILGQFAACWGLTQRLESPQAAG